MGPGISLDTQKIRVIIAPLRSLGVTAESKADRTCGSFGMLAKIKPSSGGKYGEEQSESDCFR
jgi:hypothetical protein